MKLRFDESQIDHYAKRYLNEEFDKDGERYDDNIERIVCEIKKDKREYLTKIELIGFSRWLRSRSTHWIEDHSEVLVEERTGLILSEVTVDSNKICLKGVGPAVASAILHWVHESDFPIWSGPARWSVGIKSGRNWEAYVSFCRDLAKRNDVSMRTLDRALWKYGKHRRA